MAMTAIATAAVAALTSGVQLYEANQQKQHAEGAAQAENDAINKQISDEQKQTTADKTKQAEVGSTTQTAALAALRASMSGSSGYGGTLLTSPSGAGLAPTSGKTLLGA